MSCFVSETVAYFKNDLGSHDNFSEFHVVSLSFPLSFPVFSSVFSRSPGSVTFLCLCLRSVIRPDTGRKN